MEWGKWRGEILRIGPYEDIKPLIPFKLKTGRVSAEKERGQKSGAPLVGPPWWGPPGEAPLVRRDALI